MLGMCLPGPSLPGSPMPGPLMTESWPPARSAASFLNLFGNSDLSLQEIADKTHQLQQKIDENAEQEKAKLRESVDQKYREVEHHAAELTKHAASSIEAYKTAQLQTADREKAYQQAVVRQQAEQAKRIIDQQAAQAINAIEARDRQLELQKKQQELGQRAVPEPLHSHLGGLAASYPPVLRAGPLAHGPLGPCGVAGLRAGAAARCASPASGPPAARCASPVPRPHEPLAAARDAW